MIQSPTAADPSAANERPITRREMFALRWWYPVAVFLSAYVLRLFHVGHVVNFLDDRWANVPSAFNYTRFGLLGPDNWFTQPVKHVLMYADILVFGNDPVGWAMRQVLFGAGVVLLTYLLARRLFRAHFPALFAAGLLALDPLNISFSRASSEDPLAVLFILAALFFWVRAVQDERELDWLAAGVLIGIASATRWYALLVAALMFAVALVVRRKDGRTAVVNTGAALSLLPLASYLVWFMPWIARGYSLRELWSLQLDSYLVQLSGAYPTFDSALAVLTGPGGWFTRWIGVSTVSAAGTYTTIMNDPVIWVLFVPAVAYLGWIAYRRRLPEYWLVVLVFTVLYGFFLTANRPIYLYSALTVVPFGFMALGYAASRLLRKWSIVVFALMLAWSLYLYPLSSAIHVPDAPYAWLIARVGPLEGR